MIRDESAVAAREEPGAGVEGAERPPRLRVLHMAHIRWYNAEVQYALDLAVEMRRRGHAAAFFGQEGTAGVRRARQAGLPAWEEAGFNRKGVGGVQALPAALRLYSLLRRRRFHAVLVHRSEGLPLIALAGKAAGIPVIRVRGDMRPVRRDPFNRFLYTQLLAGVVASNRTIEQSLAERAGRISHLRVIHGGVDESLFHPRGPRADVRGELDIPQERFLVGLLGRIDRVKGQQDFLSAARMTLPSCEKLQFVILDKETEPGAEALRAQVSEDPVLRDRVAFLGHRQDLPSVLRAFDLGVVASVGSEANCRVGLEWMASGVPLVATRVGVLPDLVVPGRTGAIVPPGKPEALAAAVAELAGDRQRARQQGKMARERVLSRFTLAGCARAHEQFIHAILKERQTDHAERS